MPRIRIGLSFTLVALGMVAIAACSDDERPAATTLPGIDAGTGGSQTDAETDTGGEDVQPPEDAPDGEEADVDVPDTLGVCGDGVLEPIEEDCDGTEFAPLTCQDFGFQSGDLACNQADCTFDTSGCTGVEDCSDGMDNDGDGLVDCSDTDDCDSVCADPCLTPPTVPDPGTAAGTTVGASTLTDSSCTPSTIQSGPERIYSFTAANTGVLEVNLTTSALLNVSVRTGCADPLTEIICRPDRLEMPIAQGESVFLVVDGYQFVDQGAFTLKASSRPIVCGDGNQDGTEQCDDENFDPGDGCDPSCMVEATEIEPNETVAEASPFLDPYYALIDPAGDVDVIAVPVTQPNATLVVDTWEMQELACERGEIDSWIDIIDSDGSGVLASDDDSGEGFCAHAEVSGLNPGTYYVRVLASPQGQTPAFSYQLGVSVQ